MARFNTNGTLDISFGGGSGWMSPLILNGSHFFDVELDASGQINVAGFVITALSQDAFLAARFSSTGVLDATHSTLRSTAMAS